MVSKLEKTSDSKGNVPGRRPHTSVNESIFRNSTNDTESKRGDTLVNHSEDNGSRDNDKLSMLAAQAEYLRKGEKWGNAIPYYIRMLDHLLPFSGKRGFLDEVYIKKFISKDSSTKALDELLSREYRDLNFDAFSVTKPDGDNDCMSRIFLYKARLYICFFKRSSEDDKTRLVIDGKTIFSGFPTELVGAFVIWKDPNVKPGNTAFRIESVKNKIHALSWIFAHLAQCKMMVAFNLQTIDGVLLDKGVNLLRREATFFDLAIYLHPSYSWAMAHRGDFYRELANRWSSVNKDYSGDIRFVDYMMSINYFDRALSFREDYAWAQAHLGASIVNARAFFSVENLVEVRSSLKSKESYQSSNVIQIVEILMSSFYDDLIEHYQSKISIDRSIKMISNALKNSENYYPWAQAYLGASFFIKVFDLTKKYNDPLLDIMNSDRFINYAYLWTSTLMDAYIDTPNLLVESREPGRLYDQSTTEVAYLLYWTKHYDQAWIFAHLALERSFATKFYPGLQHVVISMVIVRIAKKYLARKSNNTGDYINLIRSLLPDDFKTIEEYFENKTLYNLVDELYRYKLLPSVNKYLQYDKSENNTKIETGFSTSIMALDIYMNDLDEHYAGQEIRPPEVDSLIKELENKSYEISTKLNSDSPLASKCTMVSNIMNITRSDENLLSALLTGKVGYTLNLLIYGNGKGKSA